MGIWRGRRGTVYLGGLWLLGCLAVGGQTTFDQFKKSDADERRQFQERQGRGTNAAPAAAKAGLQPAARPAPGSPVRARDVAANRVKAEAALKLYEQTRAGLQKLRQMVVEKDQREQKLYQFTPATWSTAQISEWRAIEAYKGEINAQRERVKVLTTQWDRDYGFMANWTEFGRLYELKSHNPGDPPDQTTIKEYDLVKYRIARMWPTGPQDPPPECIRQVKPAPRPPPLPPEALTPSTVNSGGEPPETCPPPEWPEEVAGSGAEGTSGTGVEGGGTSAPGSGKPWEEMTVEERHEALKKNDPAAWARVKESLLSGDPASVAEAVEALGRPPGSTGGVGTEGAASAKPWEQMTAAERHEALKKNDPAAWAKVREALLSGDAEALIVVLEALSGKSAGTPPLAPEMVAIAYWQGYQLGQQESALHPQESLLETTANAYQIPALVAAVREGYADAVAGKPPQYQLPTSVPGVTMPTP